MLAQPNKDIYFERFDSEFFEKRIDKFIDLYLRAFTEGEYAQHISHASAVRDLTNLINKGFGVAAFNEDLLIGFALATALAADELFPKQNHPEIDVDNTMYIAEVLVDAKFRGLKIASQLISRLGTKLYQAAAIRVWDENIPAVKLYQKLGFETIDSIYQSKLNAEKELFQMKKIYLYKKL